MGEYAEKNTNIRVTRQSEEVARTPSYTSLRLLD